MPPGEPFHVNFVDDRFVQLAKQRLIALPVEPVVDDDRFRHVRSAVGVVALEIVAAERIRKHRRRPVDLAADGARVRIDQQLRRIAAVSLSGIPGAVHAESVALAGADAAQVAVPAERGPLLEVETGLTALLIEEAQLDAVGDLREDREARAVSVPRRAQRERLPRSNDHACHGW
jgi:hypothetical protein